MTSGGSSTVHIYTQTIQRTTQLTQTIHSTTQLTNWEEWGPCPVFANYTVAFAIQLRKKHGRGKSNLSHDGLNPAHVIIITIIVIVLNVVQLFLLLFKY